MNQRWFLWLTIFVIIFTFGCGENEIVETNEEIDISASYQVTADEAIEIAIENGAIENLIIYIDVVPQDIDSNEIWESSWAVVQENKGELLTIWIDPWTGEILDVVPPHDGLRAHIKELKEMSALSPLTGSTPGSYNSEPWGNRLPLKGAIKVTCGYGGDSGACRNHQGNYALDLAQAIGSPIYAAHSGYVMYTSNGSTCNVNAPGSRSYGCQVILQTSTNSSTKAYITRYAHLNGIDTNLVRPGWWLWNDRQLGTVGKSGDATGYHTHFEWLKGTSSGSTISGESLPITKWPGSNDGFCNGGLNKYNFSGVPNLWLTVGSSGC